MEALSKMIDNLSTQRLATAIVCDICGGGHDLIDCSFVDAAHGPTEQVDFVGSVPDNKETPTVAPTTQVGGINPISFGEINGSSKSPNRIPSSPTKCQDTHI